MHPPGHSPFTQPPQQKGLLDGQQELGPPPSPPPETQPGVNPGGQQTEGDGSCARLTWPRAWTALPAIRYCPAVPCSDASAKNPGMVISLLPMFASYRSYYGDASSPEMETPRSHRRARKTSRPKYVRTSTGPGREVAAPVPC
jgi:hypothetical protein